jgi:nicotinate-nucleotide adenylyltransferase
MKFGLLGGTFDPVHAAHLAIADSVFGACALDKVLFVPAASPPHKDSVSITEFGHRYKMVELAIENDPRFEVSSIESLRSGKSFTEDTLEEMRVLYPDVELYWIIGSDSACELHLWQSAKRLVEMARFVVVARPGWPMDDVKPELRDVLTVVDMPEMDISATEIRARVSRDESITDLVPPAVADYIREHDLYR